MSKLTIYSETQRTNRHGYDEILWTCRLCKHRIQLPQQQNFNYCPHCGAKIIRKLGGEVRVH